MWAFKINFISSQPYQFQGSKFFIKLLDVENLNSSEDVLVNSDPRISQDLNFCLKLQRWRNKKKFTAGKRQFLDTWKNSPWKANLRIKTYQRYEFKYIFSDFLWFSCSQRNPQLPLNFSKRGESSRQTLNKQAN